MYCRTFSFFSRNPEKKSRVHDFGENNIIIYLFGKTENFRVWCAKKTVGGTSHGDDVASRVFKLLSVVQRDLYCIACRGCAHSFDRTGEWFGNRNTWEATVSFFLFCTFIFKKSIQKV